MNYPLDNIHKSALEGFVYIDSEELEKLETNRPIRAVNKITHKLDYGGIIRNLKNKTHFITFFDISSKRYRNFYVNQNYLFYKPKKQKKDPFREFLEVTVKKLDC
jgi:hypothetical protein